MEGLPNRKQRRLWAKQTGMLKNKQSTSLKEQMAMTLRSIEYGRQIHLANIEKILREEEERKNQRRSEMMEQLMNDGLSQEEALKKINESEEF